MINQVKVSYVQREIFGNIFNIAMYNLLMKHLVKRKKYLKMRKTQLSIAENIVKRIQDILTFKPLKQNPFVTA